MLQEDETPLPKKWHTIRRIFERLRDEHGEQGSYDAVRRSVSRQRRSASEMFIPLGHFGNGWRIGAVLAPECGSTCGFCICWHPIERVQRAIEQLGCLEGADAKTNCVVPRCCRFKSPVRA